MRHFLSDVTLGEILTVIGYAFGFLTLVYSRKGAKVAKAASQFIHHTIGQADPAKTQPSTGTTVIQKIESLSDSFESFKEVYKKDMDNVRSRQVAEEVSQFPTIPGRHSN